MTYNFIVENKIGNQFQYTLNAKTVEEAWAEVKKLITFDYIFIDILDI